MFIFKDYTSQKIYSSSEYEIENVFRLNELNYTYLVKT